MPRSRLQLLFHELVHVVQYDVLGLERYMEKRRKRNAAKDHRYMPGRKEKET